MELLPVEVRKTLPPLYSQESRPTPIVHLKLFTPDSSFTWYVTEGAEQEDGDWLLLCSDGLTEMIPEGKILDLLQEGGSAGKTCQSLIDAALQAGGRDNVTVVAARYSIPVAG